MMKILSLSKVLLVTLALSSPSFAAPIQKKFDVSKYAGYTYLSFMRQAVKPNMDRLAREGYTMCSGEQIRKVYNRVDKKVKWQVRQAGKSIGNVAAIADRLAGQNVNLNTLPNMIASVDRSVNRYKLSTFFGLACGGAITVYYSRYNYGINVHYDVREQRSGRTFGVGPGRAANDASDKKYLDDLQMYLAHDGRNNLEFYKNLFKVLLNNDPSEYRKVAKEGQSVLTDFLSVFTAEQARNLMDGHVHPHWDAALLEVTLLANFHAGQKQMKVLYFDPNTGTQSWTNKTLKQVPCQPPSQPVPARLNSYWQFSRQFSNQQHCRRSGINITKREFRALGQLLTTYVKENNPKVYQNVVKSLGMTRTKNVFSATSYFLINDKLPNSLGADRVQKITYSWMQFEYYIYRNADKITKWIDEMQAASRRSR